MGSVTEKEVTLDVALRVRKLLTDAGIDVVMTRDADYALNANKATDLNMRAELGTSTNARTLSKHSC